MDRTLEDLTVDNILTGATKRGLTLILQHDDCVSIGGVGAPAYLATVQNGVRMFLKAVDPASTGICHATRDRSFTQDSNGLPAVAYKVPYRDFLPGYLTLQFEANPTGPGFPYNSWTGIDGHPR